MDDLAAALELARRDPRRQLGRFLVLSELGRGGMGVVYRAWDPAAERAVALKVLLEDDPAARARFRREGDAVARLQHPGIVRVHEQGELAGRPFVVMELVEGRSLDKAPVPLPVDAAVALARALCDALTHAHERGVVHRDLKPANVIVGPDGRPRVLDFGLAQLLDRSRLTKSGTLLGTASYMAPEQLDGRADARSDVYSLGATLYWLLTGRPPFQGETVHNVLAALAHKDVDPPSSSNAAVSAALDGVLLRCLEKDPAARYPSATAFGGALERALRGERVEPARRGLLVPAALAGAVLLAAGAGGWWAARSGPTDPAGPSTAVAVVDPRAALDEATAALASGDPHAALAAITSARAAGATPRLQQRAAALEGEARWLLGDLLAVERSAASADPRSAELLRALLRAARTERSSGPEPLRQRPFSAGELGERPAGAFGKALLAGVEGQAAQAARDLEAAGGADATPLFLALLGTSTPEVACWLLPRVDLARAAATDAGATLAVGARAFLVAHPDDARRLAKAACAAGLAEDSRVALRAAALARMAEDLDPSVEVSLRLPMYRRAITRYRVALALDASTPPPAALLAFVQQVPGSPLEGAEVDERAAARALSIAHFRERATDPERVEATVASLRELRARATPRGRREVAFVAVEVLCHASRLEEARAWMEEACSPIDSLGLDDHDVLVQWARTLLAPAPRRRNWLEAALPILDRVLEEDPLHGDAREFRARIRMDLHDLGAEVDLAIAEADLTLAEHDVFRAVTTKMARPRTTETVQGYLAEVRRRRGGR